MASRSVTIVMKITRNQIDELDKIYRINLINGVAGYKSAFLAGTKSQRGVENVAIFGSVFHLSSNPPALGMMFRPATVPRNTLKNILDTQHYTLNHIQQDQIPDAHHTAAKYPEGVSEFGFTNLESEYLDGFSAPFVKGCPIKIGLTFAEKHKMEIKESIILIGKIQVIYLDDSMLKEDGFVNLSEGNLAGLNGLDGYFESKFIRRMPYQRPKK